MVTMLGKNVRKYAEQGYQRLGTLSSHVSDDDFAAYTALLHHLCDRCQVRAVELRKAPGVVRRRLKLGLGLTLCPGMPV